MKSVFTEVVASTVRNWNIKISSAYNLHFASEERLTEMHDLSVFLSTSWRMEKVFDYNIRQIGKVLADFYQT